MRLHYRPTLNALLFVVLLTLFTAPTFAGVQVYRIDPAPVMTTSGNVPIGGYPTLYAVPNATIKLCSDSACNTPATAYTDATGNTACPTGSPVTLAGTNVCVSTSGSQGQFGFWIQPGTYYFTVTVPGGTVFGPYPISSPNNFTISGAGIVSSNAAGSPAPMANVLDATRSNGATGGAKLAATATALTTGGVLDATNMNGAQAWNQDVFSGITQPIDFKCAAATYTVSINSTIPANVRTAAGDGCIFSINNGITLTISGPMDGSSLSLHFTGSGTVFFGGNTKLSAVYPQWWGAKGDGSNDDAPAMSAAVAAACTNGATLNIPATANNYRLVPATSITTAAGTTLAAIVMCSNMHVVAAQGATFKVANNVSSALSPVRFDMFGTNAALTDVSIVGLTMDMNGANNHVDASNTRNQACVEVSGNSALINHAVLDHISCINTAGTNFVVMAQPVGATAITLGSDWRITNSLFEEAQSAASSSDFTAIFGWADNVVIDKNTFINDTAFVIVGDLGIVSAYEVHGANQRITGNYIDKLYRGVYISGNFTSASTNIVVSGNVMVNLAAYGVAFDRAAASVQAVGQIVIANNTISLADQNMTVQKNAVQIDVPYAITDVLISSNRATKTGTSQDSAMIAIVADGTAVTKTDRIIVVDNQGTGFVGGVGVSVASAVNMGRVSIQNNIFSDLVTAGGSTPVGISVSVTLGAADNINISENRIMTSVYGVRVSGAVTTLNVYGNSYQNCTTANYDESSATITTKTTSGDTLTGIVLDGPGGTFRGIVIENAGTAFAQDRANSGSGEYRHEAGLAPAFGGFHTFYTDTAERARINSNGIQVIPGTSSQPSINATGFTTTGPFWTTNIYGISVNATQAFQVDNTNSSSNTAIEIFFNGSLVRVSVEAADTCGMGFRCLRIPN